MMDYWTSESLVVYFTSLKNSLDLLLDLGLWFFHYLDLTIQIFEDFILFW